MASANPFDLLGDDDTEDPALFIAKLAAAGPPASKPAKLPAANSAKLPSKPVPPSQAVRDARNDGRRDGGGRGFSNGRGQGGANRGFGTNGNAVSKDNGFSVEFKVDKPYEKRGGHLGPRGGFRGARRVDATNGDSLEGERPRRVFERRSGSGRGGDIKRDGAGRGNWGSATDEITQETDGVVAENEANVIAEKPAGEEENVEAEKDNSVTETEEKEPEEVQMTLEEYEKVLEEKRKALLSLRGEEKFERKVDEKEFESMQLVSKKKNDDEVFIKLGSEKDKRKEAAEKEERAKKSVSINEFLKPAEGEAYYKSGGRGRGRGRGGGRGGYGGGNVMNNDFAPSIGDIKQFPTLG